jgi:hypothetical protein
VVKLQACFEPKQVFQWVVELAELELGALQTNDCLFPGHGHAQKFTGIIRSRIEGLVPGFLSEYSM